MIIMMKVMQGWFGGKSSAAPTLTERVPPSAIVTSSERAFRAASSPTSPDIYSHRFGGSSRSVTPSGASRVPRPGTSSGSSSSPMSVSSSDSCSATYSSPYSPRSTISSVSGSSPMSVASSSTPVSSAKTARVSKVHLPIFTAVGSDGSQMHIVDNRNIKLTSEQRQFAESNGYVLGTSSLGAAKLKSFDVEHAGRSDEEASKDAENLVQMFFEGEIIVARDEFAQEMRTAFYDIVLPLQKRFQDIKIVVRIDPETQEEIYDIRVEDNGFNELFDFLSKNREKLIGFNAANAKIFFKVKAADYNAFVEKLIANLLLERQVRELMAHGVVVSV